MYYKDKIIGEKYIPPHLLILIKSESFPSYIRRGVKTSSVPLKAGHLLQRRTATREEKYPSLGEGGFTQSVKTGEDNFIIG